MLTRLLGTVRAYFKEFKSAYPGWHIDCSVLLILTTVFCLHYFHGRFIFQGDVFLNLYMHSNPQLFKAGWDPHVWGYLGWYPVYGALFPLNLLMHLFLDNVFASSPLATLTLLQINAGLSLFLLAFFVYLFLRSLGRGREGAVAGGLIVALTGFHVHTGLRELDLFYLHSFMFVPLAMMSLVRANRERSLTWALFAGLMIGVSLLGGGNSPMFLFAPFFAFLFLVEKPIKTLLSLPDILRGFLYAGIALAVGVVIASTMVVPALKYMDLSSRSFFIERETLFGYIPKFTFLTSLYREWWIKGPFEQESDFFIGVPTLVLVFLGLIFFSRGKQTIKKLTGKKGRRKKTLIVAGGPEKGVWFMAFLGLFAIISMHIVYMPELLMKPFKFYFSTMSIRFPNRFFMVLVVPLAFFAALGLDSLKDQGLSFLKKMVFFSVIGPLVILYCLLGFIYFLKDIPYAPQTHAFIGVMAITVVFCLCLAALCYFMKTRPDSTVVKVLGVSPVFLVFFLYFFARPDFPARNPDTYTYVYPAGVGETLDNFFARPIKDWQELASGEKTPFRIYNSVPQPYLRLSVWAPKAGADIAFEPLSDPATSSFLQKYSRGIRLRPVDFESPLFDLYNVRFFRTIDTVKVDERIRLRYSPFYRNPDAFERFFVTHGVKYFDSEEALLGKLRTARRDELRGNVFLISEGMRGADISSSMKTGFEEVKIIEREADRIVLRVDMKGPGHLVASEPWFPAWSATVDDKETDVLKAYGTFWAVPLEKGAHEVVFSFKDRYSLWGKIVSVVSLIIVILVCYMKGLPRSNPRQKDT